MAYPPSEVIKLSGVDRQFTPEEEQIVDGEPQIISQAPVPLVDISEPDRRMEPLPVTSVPTAEAIIPSVATPAGQVLVGQPVSKWNKFTGTDQEWRELIRWDIPIGYMGDLHEISILSDNDAKTRYRVFLANIDQQWPYDRQTTTPLTQPFRETKIPGGTSVWIELRSTDGTSINVESSLSGTVRNL